MTTAASNTARLEEDDTAIDDSVWVDWFSYLRCEADIPTTEETLHEVLTTGKTDRATYRQGYVHPSEEGDRDTWFTPPVEHPIDPTIEFASPIEEEKQPKG